MQAQDVIHFWFDELSDAQRFAKDKTLDDLMRQRFGGLLSTASAAELFGWRTSATGRLAEIVILDQFSRNIYRDTPASFAQDPQALILAQELVSGGLDLDLPLAQRSFAYMPYMHSESLAIHDQGEKLFSQAGLEDSLAFEKMHRAILERFGRYPHRNAILGRSSTREEVAFLKEPASSF